MTTTSEQLQLLLENPPYVGATYNHWYGETDEATAEAMATEAMEKWVRRVDAILRLSNRREELKQDLRSPPDICHGYHGLARK